MTVEFNEISKKSFGGTEMMGRFLLDKLPSELLDKFQITLSRIRELDGNKVRLFYGHDLPNDPESKPLGNGGWEKFHRLVFVSHWQQQAYINTFNIPWSKTVVLQNTIKPFEETPKPTDKCRLIYHTTPHRGLIILVPVFEKLALEFKDQIHLDVYSSFKIYGWDERDKPFEPIYKRIQDHPQMTYHGTVPNDTVREALIRSHIFAYPSIWPESSCICLMEAMAAGLMSIHSNFAALPETSANLTWMYQFHEDNNGHAQIFYEMLRQAIVHVLEAKEKDPKIDMAREYSNVLYGHDLRIQQWTNFLDMLKNEPTAIPTGPMFVYKTA